MKIFAETKNKKLSRRYLKWIMFNKQIEKQWYTYIVMRIQLFYKEIVVKKIREIFFINK